ncbi:MAG: endo-1,4-beta-xylanase [Terriglobia bacterium]
MRMRRQLKNILTYVLAALVLLFISVLPCHAQSLSQAAARINLQVGTAVNPFFFSNPQYAETLAREFNMIEPENAMKWTATEPAPGKFNFTAGDEVIAFAAAHHMKVRGHNLLWGQHNPAWLDSGQFTTDQLRDMMKAHIIAVASHYRGKVFAWDVVNEALGNHGEVKPGIWYDRPGIGLAGKGTEYVAQAFRWAHQADPDALLFYNDYDAEGLNAKSNGIYAMVKDFKKRGVPIDGVGLQMHVGLDNVPKDVAANIERLTALGLQVQITEMDVRLPINSSGELLDPTDLERQAKIYGEIAKICAAHPGCTAFQTWGFTDRYTWIVNFTHGKYGQPLLFNAAYEPKPAYQAVLDALSKGDAKIARRRAEIAARH